MTLEQCGLSPFPDDIEIDGDCLTLKRTDGQGPAVLLRCDDARLPAPVRQRLLEYAREALKATAGFTTEELRHDVIGRLVETGPLQSEWLAACHRELGKTAFMRACPVSYEELMDYGEHLETLLPILSRRAERTEELQTLAEERGYRSAPTLSLV